MSKWMWFLYGMLAGAYIAFAAIRWDDRQTLYRNFLRMLSETVQDYREGYRIAEQALSADSR